MSEILAPLTKAVASNREAISLGQADELGAWHTYSVEQGNESGLTSLAISRGPGPTYWNVHGLWRG